MRLQHGSPLGRKEHPGMRDVLMMALVVGAMT